METGGRNSVWDLISLEAEWREGKTGGLIGQGRRQRWIERKEGQRSPCLGSLPRAMGLLRFRQGQTEADGERRTASLKTA